MIGLNWSNSESQQKTESKSMKSEISDDTLH